MGQGLYQGTPQAVARLLPAVGNGLDVRQQVHLEGVALLKGLPALERNKEKEHSLPIQPHSLPALPQAVSPASPCHTCVVSPCCVSSCAV